MDRIQITVLAGDVQVKCTEAPHSNQITFDCDPLRLLANFTNDQLHKECSRRHKTAEIRNHENKLVKNADAIPIFFEGKETDFSMVGDLNQLEARI